MPMRTEEYTLEYYRSLALKRLYDARAEAFSKVQDIGHLSIVATLVNRAHPLAQWVKDPMSLPSLSTGRTKYILRGVHINDEGIAQYESQEAQFRTLYPQLFE
jgi:hypothetical protein